MSVAAIPKAWEARPPSGPPTKTTYDGTPSDDGDSYLRFLVENVNRLLKQAHRASFEDLEITISLLEQRKSWIIKELDFARMLSPRQSLPTVKGVFSIDYLLESPDSDIENLVRLINVIDEAIATAKAKLSPWNNLPQLSPPPDPSQS